MVLKKVIRLSEKLEVFWKNKTYIAQTLGAIILVSSLLTVNIYGYLSVLPNGFLSIIGPGFVFNYSFQLSSFVAMATLFGWQFGSLAFTISNTFSSLYEKTATKYRTRRILLKIASLNFLGGAKYALLRYFLGVMSFCFMFSDFSILLTALILFEGFIVIILVGMYRQYRYETENPLSLRSWLSERLDSSLVEIFELDWRQLDILTLLPLAIFMSLFFSHRIGEDRANHILQNEPIFLSQHNLHATIFAISSTGLILAIVDGEADKNPMFILVDSSGEEILRSRQHQ